MTVQEYAKKHKLTSGAVYGSIARGKLKAVKVPLDGKGGYAAWDISDAQLAATTIQSNGNGGGLKHRLAALEATLAELEQVVLGGE